MRVVIAFVLSMGGLIAQGVQPPLPASPQAPRDRVNRPDPTGTGIIRGRVVAADTGQPMRQANVNLIALPTELPRPPAAGTAPPAGRGARGGGEAGVGPVAGGLPEPPAGRGVVENGPTLRPRNALTDAQGAFEFAHLPPGSYRLMVNAPQYSPQYLGASYGSKRPAGLGADLGQPIVLAADEVFDKATVVLSKGAVIVGRVTDDLSQPLTRVNVYGLFYPQGSGRGMRTGPGSQTDDLGQFRLYGLQEGQYAVVAEANGGTYAPPGEEDATRETTGFLTTFYPGVPDESAAQRVRTRAGTETSGVEIQMVMGRMYHISGAVVDSQGQPLTGANGQLQRRGVAPELAFRGGFSTDPQGRFSMRNVPAGDYRLIVRARPTTIPRPGERPEVGEFAVVPLTIAGADVDGLMVTTGPGVTITGQITFAEGVPEEKPSQMRVIANNPDPNGVFSGPMPPPAEVQADLGFTMKGLAGEVLLRPMPLRPDWYIKSITAGGDDITDTPHQFSPRDRVTIVISTRASTLEGTVTNDKGDTATDCGVILFTDDKSTWRWTSTSVRRATVSQTTGRYRIQGLRPGRYLVAAIPRERMTNINAPGPEFFEPLIKDATSVVISEDEQRTVDLRLTGGS